MRLVVIGGTAAGMSAAAKARRVDPRLEIVVCEKSPVVSFGACGLPYFIEGQVTQLDDLVVHTPEYFKRERDIDVRTGTTVSEIQHGRRQLILDGQPPLSYDRLVIATGAHPIQSGIAGADQPHVFRVHDYTDGQRLQQYLKDRKPNRAVILGAGYLGLEMAEALRARGLAVTIFHAGENVLARHDDDLTQTIQARLRNAEIDLHLKTRVSLIEPDRVMGVPCDFVILSTGVRPQSGLAQQAGIALGRSNAIAVDPRQETSLPGVYAAGDCAETTDLILSRPVYIPLGTTANKTGRVAGSNAAGAREEFPGIVGTSIVSVCGLGIGLTGYSIGMARKVGVEAVNVRITAREKPRYFGGQETTVELVAERATGRLIGGSVWGMDGVAGRINVIATALTARLTAEQFQYLDFAYAPPFAVATDPMLVAAQQLLKEL